MANKELGARGYMARLDTDVFRLRVKDILIQKGLTQVWLANELGMSVANLNSAINGTGCVGIPKLIGIARALNVEFCELFARTGWCDVSSENSGSEVSGRDDAVCDNNVCASDRSEQKSRFLSKAEVVVNGCNVTRSDLTKISNATGYEVDYVKDVVTGKIAVRPLIYSRIASKLGEKAYLVMPSVRVITLQDMIADAARKMEYEKLTEKSKNSIDN